MTKHRVEQVLLAEQMSMQAVQQFMTSENEKGRPTYVYDHVPSEEELQKEENVDRVRIIYQPDLTPEKIVEETSSGQYQTLLVRPKQVLPGVNVEKVIRVGTGINNTTEWSQQSPERIVMNTPGQNAGATVEYTIKALLRIVAPTLFDEAKEEILNGSLSSRDLSRHFSTELQGKKIAVIGMGDIGIRVAQILKHCDVDVIGWGYQRENGSESFSQEDALNMGIRYAKTLEEAFEGVDGATIHIPGGPKTDKLINYDLLSRMKPGARIVNAARGPIIDTDGLDRALEEGIIGGFVADADWLGDYSKDPLGPYVVLVEKYSKTHSNILITPHLGGDVTQETNYNATLQALKQVGFSFWDKIIYNGKTKLPEGYKDGGVVKPEGIGHVTSVEINKILSTKGKHMEKQLEVLSGLIKSGQPLTPEQISEFLSVANSFAQALPLGRPFEGITK